MERVELSSSAGHQRDRLRLKAARSGRSLLLESGGRPGGCLQSLRTADGLVRARRAHHLQQLRRFPEIAAGSGATAKLVQRGPARARFGYLRDGAYEWLSPALPRRFNWLEIALR
jgi:UDP-galactopyranose mutase